MKKVLCAILACALATATLWGCNPAEKNATTQESINISFSFWEPSIKNDLEKALEKIVANYNQIHPEVRIELISKQVDGYEEWLKEQFASNKAPTIISDHAPYVQDHYEKGLSIDLSEAMNNPTPYSDVPWKELFKDMDSIKKLEGTGLAWFDFGMAYYYNVDLYENLGLAVPETWSEFMHNCDVMQERGVTPIALMAQKPAALEWLGQYVASGLLGNSGAEFKEFDTDGSSGISDVEFAEIVKAGRQEEFKNKFIKNQKDYWETIEIYLKYTSNAVEIDENEAKEQILDGVAGHIMSGSWDVKNLYAKHEGKNRMGIFRIPKFTSEESDCAGDNLYIGGVQALCVSACGTEEERAAAIDFLEFLFSEDQYRIFIDETMQLPTMNGYDTDQFKELFVPEKGGHWGWTFHYRAPQAEYILKMVTGAKLDYDAEAEKMYERYYGESIVSE